MIKAVIFDCFGVLTIDGWQSFRQKHIEQDRALSLRATELNQMADRGEISFDTFLQEISQMTSIDYEVAKREISIHPPDSRLLGYIASLRSDYLIGMLSNAAMDWTHELFTGTQLKLFDSIVLSCELGILKPDPEMYATIANRLGVDPSECVYTDDRQTCVDGALALGMQAILFENIEQFISDFEQLLTASAG